MSTTTIKALPHLASLQSAASHASRKHSALQFKFRRTSVDALPAIQELADMGIKVRVYTGNKILTCDNGQWSTRTARRTRHYVAVQVCGVA